MDIAAEAIVAAYESDQRGLFHLGGPQRLSRLDMGCAMAEQIGADSRCLVACSRLSIESDEPRPADLSLDCSKWRAAFPDVSRPTFEHTLTTILKKGSQQ